MPDRPAARDAPRMADAGNWMSRARDRLEAERPGLIAQVRDFVDDRGPCRAARWSTSRRARASGAPGGTRATSRTRSTCCSSPAEVASSRGRNFARTYDATERAWGLPRGRRRHVGTARRRRHARQLFDRALAACGIGTPADLRTTSAFPSSQARTRPMPRGRGLGGIGRRARPRGMGDRRGLERARAPRDWRADAGRPGIGPPRTLAARPARRC